MQTSKSDGEIQMPKYKCHKEVSALKIRKIVEQTSEDFLSSGGPQPDGAMIYPVEAIYAPFLVDQAYIEKHKPEVGGYFVVYKDGYKSYSPADAFEDGYTKMEK